VKVGLSARRLLPGEPVHRLPQEVGMAVVPGEVTTAEGYTY
jgi:hypothetical protein